MSRVRTRTQGPTYATLTGNGSCSHWPTQSHWNSNPYLVLDIEEIMTDVVVPNYYGRIRDGEIINNPCTYSSIGYSLAEHEDGPSTCTVSNSGGDVWTKTSGNLSSAAASLFGTPSSWITRATPSSPTFDTESDAKQGCLGKVDSTPYEFFEDIWEISETLRFLRNPLSSIADLARSFSRRKNRLRGQLEGPRLDKALANLWNQYRFAFAPLLRSLIDGMELFENWNDIERPKRRHAHWTSTSDVEEASENASNQWGSHNMASYTILGERWKESHATIMYEVSNPLTDWSFKLGLRKKDMPTNLWQVFPLSFMLDRLWDVTSFSKGLINMIDPSITFLAASCTTKTHNRKYLQFRGMWDGYSHFTVKVQSRDSLVYDEFSYVRELWSPSVLDTWPVFDLHGLVNDATKVADLVAIIISKLGD